MTETQTLARPEAPASADQIADNLSFAVKTVYKISGSPQFQAACIGRGVDPIDNFGSQEYLDVLAAFGHKTAERGLANGGDPLRFKSIELVTATPAGVNADISLKFSGPNPSKANKQKACTFNNTVRSFAESFPEVTVSDLSAAMLNVVNMNKNTEDVQASNRISKNAPDSVRNIIHGAQHEIAVGKIAAFTGRAVVPASVTQDLRGTDWIVGGNDGWPILNLDVKSSLFKIESSDRPDSPYAIGPGGNVSIFSLCRPNDFGDHVVIPDAVAEQKAPAFDTILEEVQRDLSRSSRTLIRSA